MTNEEKVNEDSRATTGTDPSTVATINDARVDQREPVGERGPQAEQSSTVQYNAQEFSFDRSLASSAQVAVTRTGDASRPASVDYQTSDVSAVAGIDYSPTHGTLTFNNGETQKSFDVAVLKQPTSGKTNLIVELLNPQGAALGDPHKAVLTISPSSNSKPQPGTPHWSSSAVTLGQYLIFAALGIAFVYFIITTGQTLVISKDTGLNTVEAARSLITFLIAACTVGIALVLTFSSIISSGPEFRDRFTQGKEILTVLIGVLGTIVGFYFGQATKTPSPAEPGIAQSQNLQVSPPTISNLAPAKGEKTTINTKVTGGRPPYRYTINFTPPEIVPDIKEGNSTDGTITQEITIPENLAKDTQIKFKITVKDADGKSVTYDDPSRQFTAKASASIL